MPSSDLPLIFPRVLIVSRRTVRKNKFVDFVGEYHLDLIVKYGAVPVIVPRVAGLHMLLDSFEPIHGVLLCEGEDIDPSHYHEAACDASAAAAAGSGILTKEELEEIRRLHASDTAVDREKDSIELRLAKLCLERNIPYLGICRRSQILNVACGGTLYQDVEKEISHRSSSPFSSAVSHIDYDNYDGHRHSVTVVPGTPLQDWFKESISENGAIEIDVNSYHHQGVKGLAARFVPMAYAKEGLVEGFYDPDGYNPDEGKFIMGLQFHPERMRRSDSDEFDYPGCPKAYQEFVKAVVAYQKKINNSMQLKNNRKMDQEVENKREVILRSFSIAKNMYDSANDFTALSKERDLEAGAEFLESNMASLSVEQQRRLHQIGATLRNSSSYLRRLKLQYESEAMARSVMRKMTVEQLSHMLSFYHMMADISSEALQNKITMAS